MGVEGKLTFISLTRSQTYFSQHEFYTLLRTYTSKRSFSACSTSIRYQKTWLCESNWIRFFWQLAWWRLWHLPWSNSWQFVQWNRRRPAFCMVNQQIRAIISKCICTKKRWCKRLGHDRWWNSSWWWRLRHDWIDGVRFWRCYVTRLFSTFWIEPEPRSQRPFWIQTWQVPPSSWITLFWNGVRESSRWYSRFYIARHIWWWPS